MILFGLEKSLKLIYRSLIERVWGGESDREMFLNKYSQFHTEH